MKGKWIMSGEQTPEEMLIDFEPDEDWWKEFFKWAEACNMAAEKQYQEEQEQP